MTKPLILALALAGLSTLALAQAPATGAPAPAATGVSAEAAPVAPAATAAPQVTLTGALVPGASAPGATGPGALVNPFNGKQLGVEVLQRELELSRYRTQLLEEQLKQTSVGEEIKNVPVRKAVEVAQARTQQKKEEAATREIEAQMKAPPARPAGSTSAAETGGDRVTKKSAKVLAKEKAEAEVAARRAAQQAAAQAAEREAAIPPATLLSVISVGGKNSVVLDIRGNIATIADGETSSAGAVKVLDRQSASVGGRTLKVHQQTLGRYVVSDLKTVAAFAPTGLPSGTTISGSNVTALPPSIPMASGALPPPPLPSGLSSNPAKGSPIGTALPSLQR